MLDRSYNSKEAEPRIYEAWERSGFFNPDNLPLKKNAKPFTVIMPPPNANGALHLGHAVGTTLQDVLTRFYRMRGRRALWLPGADHAGFETQVVFDKRLEKEGRNRFKMSRGELWAEIWNFTQENKVVMENQLRRLGASCDWSREKFTLDPNIVNEVYATFQKLHEDGLVYRDFRVVNWCPKHRTALSELEVKYIERTDPLYFIKYGPLTLATVRPETKFGDTALAVNPKDARYKKYIGKTIEATGILGPLKFKVIADNAIDPKFGTGVVKVTPAHDATDFEIWSRHKDEIAGPKVIIDEGGKLTGDVGEFKGLKVAEARQKVAEKMKEIGILEKVEENYVHQVATCYKCGSTLEPIPKPQWFIKMKPLAQKAIKAVKKNKIKFHPESAKKVYFHWLNNIRDWNISLQIIWGIRIPAWFCVGCKAVEINKKTKGSIFLVRHGETDWNVEKKWQGHPDIPLNAEGEKQAQAVAEALKKENIELIVSSDLIRARRTAEIIKEKTGAELIIDKNLREKSFGDAEGMTSEEARERYGPILNKYHEKLPNGESFEEVEKRIWNSVNQHQKDHSHKKIVFVTHGGALRTLRRKIMDVSPEEIMTIPKVKNGEILKMSVIDPCKKCGSSFFEQDPDVFSTWFSSGQWPFLALDYPKGKDYKKFYPTDVMETGHDILFFWVARMIMFGLYRTRKAPFKNVYLHGLVRDKDRQKMSKSKGNVIDPLGVSEIYGTDAVRMALVVGNTPGNDIVISEDKIRGYRNFATKIWNISKFVIMNRRDEFSKIKPKLSKEDARNLKGLGKIKREVTKHIERFEFHLAAEKIYHYAWHAFADKIIEEAKPRLRGENVNEAATAYKVVETILIESLKMLHPFMPFITEEIWGAIPKKSNDLLMITPW